jgi:hypothetical protein
MYAPLGLCMHPMDPVYALLAHLCPLGLICTPPLKRAPPPPYACAPPLCVCALGLFYALWGSFMPPLGLLCMLLLEHAHPHLRHACPLYVCVPPP